MGAGHTNKCHTDKSAGLRGRSSALPQHCSCGVFETFNSESDRRGGRQGGVVFAAQGSQTWQHWLAL
jgi:hypothetical protein